jgi:hypothetical protein
MQWCQGPSYKQYPPIKLDIRGSSAINNGFASNTEGYQGNGYSNTSLSSSSFTGTLTGIIWKDSNKNSKQEKEEILVACTTVTLTNKIGETLMAAVTSTTGYWVFANIPTGDYTVKVDLQSGLVLSTCNCNEADVKVTVDTITVVDTAVIQQQTFSSRTTGALTGAFWIDTNSNGRLDNKKTPVADVPVFLIKITGEIILTTTSSKFGAWTIKILRQETTI